MSMIPPGIEPTTLKIVGQRPDKLREFQEFEIHNSQLVKVINLTILRTGRLYVRE
jgi:hypothetical protein